MSPCERWEVLVEQRAAGQLDPAQRAGLEQHLAACAPCAAFAAGVESVQAALHGRAEETLRWVDWTRFEREVRRQVRVVRLFVPACLGLLAVATVAALALRRPGEPGWAVGLALGWALVLGSAWRISRRWLLKWSPGRWEGGPVVRYQAWLQERERDARQSLWIATATGLASPVLLALSMRGSALEWAVLALAPATCLGAAAWLRAVELPRLKRQREALG